MADAEKKYLSELDFDTQAGEDKLTKLINQLNGLADTSEKTFQNMSSQFKNVLNGINNTASNAKIDLNFINSKEMSKQIAQFAKEHNLNAKEVQKLYTNLYKRMIGLQNEQNKAFIKNKQTELAQMQKVYATEQKEAIKTAETIKRNESSIEKNREIQNEKRETNNQKTTNAIARQENELNNKLILLDKKRQLEIEKSYQNNNLSSKISKMANTYLATQGLNELKKAASETIQEMVQVESQMNAIDRVMEEGSINVREYRDELIQLAYDYGNSFDNVSDVTLRLAQAGFDAEESLALTEKTLLALNTADLDATEATSDMVAVMAQWGLMTGNVADETENYAAIIDKVNKVADNFPTTSKDILDALKKTSSAFNLAGASIDETIASIVAAEKASQRGGKEIGNALNNIISQLKEEKKINIAESLGLDFYTDETKTQFKDIMDILGEMSERMQALKNAGKENTVEMQNLLSIFTIFRRNIGSSLLGEMAGEESTYAEVLKTSMDSIGYSLQENEKYMKTAEAAQAQFNATLLSLKTSVWDNGLEDVFRSMLLLGENITSGINTIVKNFGILPTTVATATLAFSLFNKQIMNIKQIKTATDYVKDVKAALDLFNDTTKKGEITAKEFNNIIGDDVPKSLKKYVSSVKSGEASLIGYIAKTALAKAGTLALKTAVTALKVALSFALTLVIDAIVEALINWIQASEKAAEAISDMNGNIDDSKSKLEEYVSKFETLREEMNSSDITQEEYNKKKLELIKIQEELIKKYGKEAEGINLVTGSIEEQTKAINDLAKSDYKKYIQENEKEIQRLANTFTKKISEPFNFMPLFGEKLSDDFKEFIKSLSDEVEGIKASSIYGNGKEFTLGIGGTGDEVLQTYRDLYDKLDEYRTNASEDELNTVNKVIQEVSNKIKKLEGEYGEDYETYQKYLSNRLQLDEYYSDIYGRILEARANLEKAIASGNLEEIEEAKEKLNNVYNEAKEKAEDDPIASEGMKKKFEDDLEDIQKMANKNAIKIKLETEDDGKLKEELQDILDKMGNISTKDLKDAFDTGDITEQMQELKNKLDENGISIEDLIDNFEFFGLTLGETSEKVEETANNMEAIKEATQSAIDDLANLESGFTSVYNAMNEFNENGYISASTLKSLVDNNLLQYFDVVNGKLSINEAAMANAATAAKILAAEQLAAEAAAEILAIAQGNVASVEDSAKGSASGLSSNTRILASALLEAGKAGSEGAVGIQQFWNAIKDQGGVDVDSLTQNAKDQIAGVITSFQNSLTALNSINVSAASYGRVSAKSSGGSRSSSSGSNSAAKAAEEAAKAAEEAAKAAEEARKKIIDNFEKIIDERERLEDRWVKNKKGLGLISDEDEKYILQESIKRYRTYVEEVNQLTMASEEEKLELRKKYAEEAEDLEVEYFKLLKDIMEDQIDAIEDRYKESVDKYKDSIDEKIDLIKEQADAEIAALDKVEDENDRIRQKEEYERNRSELIHGHQGVEYWQQRTGREAQLALAEAKKKVDDLDRNWEETVNKWNVEDQIKLIEERRDKDIEATEQERDAYLEALEATKNAEIQALKDKYQYQLNYFNQTGQIIQDNATIQARNLYETYKRNFIDPVGEELRQALAAQTQAPAAPAQSSSITYTIQYGDTLTSIAKKYGTTIDKIMAENPYITNKNLIYAGKQLKIPTSHTGSKIIKDGLVELQAGETVLNMNWAKGLDKMLGQFTSQTNNTNNINNGSTIQIDGSLVNVEANIEDKTDAVYLTRRITKELTQKFNIKK